jgi:hypothetical protein
MDQGESMLGGWVERRLGAGLVLVVVACGGKEGGSIATADVPTGVPEAEAEVGPATDGDGGPEGVVIGDPSCVGKPVGAECDDGEPCTDGDRCNQQGKCLGETSTYCPDLGSCELGYCESGVGCKTKLADPGAICQIPCYGLAFCDAEGKCLPDPDSKKICQPQKGSCEDTVECVSGECQVIAYKDVGDACDLDADACTIDKCNAAGGCVTSKDDPCEEAKISILGQCSIWVCASGGKCVQTGGKPDGTPCDDKEGCTTNDKCLLDQGANLGKCTGKPIQIDDQDPCTNDTCLDGVVDHKIQAGVTCSGDACDPVGVCTAEGACDYDGCPCTKDIDCPKDPCQGVAYCDKGGNIWHCQFQPGTAYVCEQPDNLCQFAECDSSLTAGDTPNCVKQNKPDSTLCNDGNDCNQTDTCQAGTCKPDDLPDCDDDAFCNGIETCTGFGKCVDGTPPMTDDGVACTIDACDEENATVTHTPDDSPCQNGLYCDGTEVCDMANGCQPALAPEVDDAVACTADACTEGPGPDQGTVSHVPDGAHCDDHEYCTTEVCDSAQGCQYTKLVDGTDCAGKDDDLCSTGETCAGGICEGKTCGDVGKICVGTQCASVTGVTFRSVSVSGTLAGSGSMAHLLVNSTVGGDLPQVSGIRGYLSYLAQWLGYKE